MLDYTIRIEQDAKSGWLCGQCEQLPEAISQGKDLDELMYMMQDAIDLVLECKRDAFRATCTNENAMVRKLKVRNEARTVIRASKRKQLCTV